MRVAIVYWRFLKFDGKGRFIGGIETYISLLIAALKNEYKIEIYQCAELDFIEEYDGVKVNKISIILIKGKMRYMARVPIFAKKMLSGASG